MASHRPRSPRFPRANPGASAAKRGSYGARSLVSGRWPSLLTSSLPRVPFSFLFIFLFEWPLTRVFGSFSFLFIFLFGGSLTPSPRVFLIPFLSFFSSVLFRLPSFLGIYPFFPFFFCYWLFGFFIVPPLPFMFRYRSSFSFWKFLLVSSLVCILMVRLSFFF